MANTVLKYSLTFLIGVIFTYLIVSQKTSLINEYDSNAIASKIKPTIDVTSPPQINQDESQLVKEQLITEQHLLLECEEEVDDLTKKRQTDQQSRADSMKSGHQQLLAQLTKTMSDNVRLKHRLEQYEPSAVSDDKIKALVPEEYAAIVTGFSGKIKEQIVEFHQEEEDQDWGLRKQQELLYFINTHQNGHEVMITSLICKIDQCQLILDEKTTPISLKESGLNDDEINSITDSQQPKYKQIFDDLKLQSDLNLWSPIYTPNRFGIYALLKDKSTLNNNLNF